ncbi:hypothetical protein [Psychrobium sp. 1_MG-2023]|uniref:hypothetical protein n=1 Tax=Psychrobium sp. 1_MG-2023 TaxID=3062624 RepID=UPI000C33E86E|nr:hypothetical protein [Psychrobium sp. 1_MG-2023]MDP2561410.1 hypothetical protein [Psychrobium sp. 1_MG-2023]PKF54889.1 hypothetical protein CW748_15190 [Alteromonadales bacterium alter-6D02]
MEHSKVSEKSKLLASSFIERMAWEQCQKILKTFKFSTGLGAQKTLVKLENDFDHSEVIAQKFLSVIEPLHRDMLRSGDKTIMVFNVGAETLSKVKERISKVSVKVSPESEAFPCSLHQNSLTDVTTDIKLVSQEKIDDKSIYYFSTKRSITVKKELTPSMFDFDDSVATALSKYSKITAISEQPRQYFDVVVLDEKLKTVELRLDIAHAVSAKDISKLFMELKGAFLDLIGNPKSLGLFSDPINFFPMINKTYENKAIRICEISFTTEDGYVHHERDRNTMSDDGTIKGDVRLGKFHIGGIEKCSDINLYRISSRWPKAFEQVDVKFDVEVSLNSTFRELSKLRVSDRNLEYIEFSNCPSLKAMDAIICKLIQSEKNDLPNTAS